MLPRLQMSQPCTIDTYNSCMSCSSSEEADLILIHALQLFQFHLLLPDLQSVHLHHYHTSAWLRKRMTLDMTNMQKHMYSQSHTCVHTTQTCTYITQAHTCVHTHRHVHTLHRHTHACTHTKSLQGRTPDPSQNHNQQKGRIDTIYA